MCYKILLIALLPLQCFALMELGGNFSYGKQVFGTERQNSIIKRAYSGSVAFYLFNYTALEVSYSKGRDTITQNQDADGTTISLVSDQTIIKTQTYSLGLRQAFSKSKARVVPMLSLGYAKQFIHNDRTYTIDDAGTRFILNMDNSKNRSDNIFATFSLKLRLTRRVSLVGSVNTVFRAFEFNEIKDYLRYSAGFSWFL